jgi:hypothetical protein
LFCNKTAKPRYGLQARCSSGKCFSLKYFKIF